MRGIPVPDAAIAFAQSQLSGTHDAEAHRVAVARAISNREPEQLAAAIDTVEALGRIPDAARLRIVLAEMSGDPSPLDLARPVLERLEDRQFLRRLEEVAAALR